MRILKEGSFNTRVNVDVPKGVSSAERGCESPERVHTAEGTDGLVEDRLSPCVEARLYGFIGAIIVCLEIRVSVDRNRDIVHLRSWIAVSGALQRLLFGIGRHGAML